MPPAFPEALPSGVSPSKEVLVPKVPLSEGRLPGRYRLPPTPACLHCPSSPSVFTPPPAPPLP